MGLAARQRVHRLQGGRGVAGHPEIVGVHVDGVGEAELVHGAADRLQHLARRHPVAGHLAVDPVDVAAGLLEHLDAAGVDELDAVAAGRLKPPRDRVAQLRCDRAAGLTDQLEQHLVVAHQDQERLVDHRRVAQLGEHVPGGQRWCRGLDHGRVAEQRIPVAGRERRRHQPAGAAAQQLGALERIETAPCRARACARGWPWDRRCGRGCRRRRASPPSRARRSAARRRRRRRRPCRPSGRGRAARRRRRWRGRESRRR